MAIKVSPIQGFTLIELLVVIAIISMLASVVLNTTVHAGQQGKNSHILTSMSAYSYALEQYYGEHGAFPNTTASSICLGDVTYCATCHDGASCTLHGDPNVVAALAPYLASNDTPNPYYVPYFQYQETGVTYVCQPNNAQCNSVILIYFIYGPGNCPPIEGGTVTTLPSDGVNRFCQVQYFN